MTPFQMWVEINRWHRQRGFVGFGYHALIAPSGEAWAGRPYNVVGAHTIEANRGSLGFLLIESDEIKRIGEYSDYFTDAQKATARRLIAQAGGIKAVRGHNDYANKLCPGFRVEPEKWLPR